MKRLFSILLFVAAWQSLCYAADSTVSLKCGTWVEIAATPFDTYRFDHWSDGSTEAVRTIELMSDTSLVAFFVTDCRDYTNWPLVTLYDWVLMLDVNYLNEQGVFVDPSDVSWYRVVGQPDDILDSDLRDDELLATGYYLTLDQNLWGTGAYYAEISVASTAQGELICNALMRTMIADYTGSRPASTIALMPSLVEVGAPMRLIGLPSDADVQLRIFDMSGHRVSSLHSDGEEQLTIHADYLPGCYLLKVNNDNVDETLKFVVINP